MDRSSGIYPYLYIMKQEVKEIIDLRERQNNIQYSDRFMLKNMVNTNEKLGLKKDDVVEFWSGYNGDIRYRAEILGFNTNGEAYIKWDCYWFPIDLVEREYKFYQE